MRKHVLAAVAFALMGAAHASAQSTFWIDASALNVRNGPWGSIIGQVHYGQVYVELEVQGEWTKLWFDNREGWVYNAYTQYASQTAHRVTTSWLNVRSGPGTGYGIVGGAPGDSWWAVIGSDGAWRQINYGGGAYWVHGDYLSTSGGSSPAPAPAPPPPPPPAPSGAQFVYPVSGPLTSVYYTVRSYGYHSALDIADWEWAEIGAARSGTVNWTGWWAATAISRALITGPGMRPGTRTSGSTRSAPASGCLRARRSVTKDPAATPPGRTYTSKSAVGIRSCTSPETRGTTSGRALASLSTTKGCRTGSK